MRVRDVMAAAPARVGPDTPLKLVASTLLHHGVGAVPVIDAGERLMGIVSESDLLEVEAGNEGRVAPPTVRVARDVMTRTVITVGPDVTLPEAVRLMRAHAVRHVPVAEDGRLVGMLQATDLVRVLARPDEDIAREIECVLRDDGLLIDPIRSSVADGVVTFSGVSAPGLRRHLVDVGRSIPGVVAVEVAPRDHSQSVAAVAGGPAQLSPD